MPYMDEGRLSADEKKRREDIGAAFEDAVALAYEDRGYTVERVGSRGGENGRKGDGGVDLFVSKDGVTAAVQCKCWRRQEVPIGEVQRLMGIVSKGRKNATRGVLITTSRFTPAAVAEAEPHIELIDGDTLFGRLGLEPSWFHMVYAARAPDAVLAAPTAQSAVSTTHFPVLPRATVPPPSRPSVVARPLTHVAPRWLVAICALALLVAAGTLLRGAAHPEGVVDAPTTAPAGASSTDAPLEKVRKLRAPGERSVANRHQAASGHGRTAVATSADALSATAPRRVVAEPASVDAGAIYKSADMSDEEFAAWKRRKAEREHQAGIAPLPEPDPANVDDPRNREPVRVSASDANAPETMRVILRTNRR